MGPNFEFKCMQSQLISVEPFFIFVDPATDPANLADFSADSFINLLDSWFDFNIANLFYFGKLTIMSFFMSLIFLALSNKSLILM